MQNGFLFNRVREKGDRVFWKCALTTCSAVMLTDEKFRPVDNRNNVHMHDKTAYAAYRRALKTLK
jgi:hypothetical protein